MKMLDPSFLCRILVLRSQTRSSPFGEQGHESASETDAGERKGHPTVGRLHHPGVEEDLVAQKFDESGIEQDTGGEGVEGSRCAGHGGTVGVQRLPQTETDGDTEGAREGNVVSEGATLGHGQVESGTHVIKA